MNPIAKIKNLIQIITFLMIADYLYPFLLLFDDSTYPSDIFKMGSAVISLTISLIIVLVASGLFRSVSNAPDTFKEDWAKAMKLKEDIELAQKRLKEIEDNDQASMSITPAHFSDTESMYSAEGLEDKYAKEIVYFLDGNDWSKDTQKEWVKNILENYHETMMDKVEWPLVNISSIRKGKKLMHERILNIIEDLENLDTIDTNSDTLSWRLLTYKEKWESLTKKIKSESFIGF